jgi:hypothetical protein
MQYMILPDLSMIPVVYAVNDPGQYPGMVHPAVLLHSPQEVLLLHRRLLHYILLMTIVR